MDSPLSVPCSGCHAKPGAPCRSEGGRTVDPHTPRVELHKQHLAELKKLEDWNKA